MNIFWTIGLSTFCTSLVGSFVLWFIFALVPGSTTGLNLPLYFSMIFFSLLVISLSGGLLTCILLWIIGVIRFVTLASSPLKMGLSGSLLYLTFTMFFLIIENEKGIVFTYFKSGGFLFHVFVGGFYGSVFGYFHKKMSIRFPTAKVHRHGKPR